MRRNQLDKDRHLRSITNPGRPAAPAKGEEEDKDKPNPKAAPAGKGNQKGPNPPKGGLVIHGDPNIAAPFLPGGPQKTHEKGKKGKKGKGKPRSTSSGKIPIGDRPCIYHFNKGGCRDGGKCPYSHKQKDYDKAKAGKTGKNNPPNTHQEYDLGVVLRYQRRIEIASTG